MKLTRIQPYGPDAYTYWISGIYKIVSYNRGQYHAYFIQDYANNWGDNVSKPPLTDRVTGSGYWPTLKSATRACKQHALDYSPAPRAVKRASAIKEALIEKSMEVRQ